MPPKGTTRIPCGTIDEMGRQKGTGKTGRARTKQVGSGLSKFDAKIQKIFGICKFLDAEKYKNWQKRDRLDPKRNRLAGTSARGRRRAERRKRKRKDRFAKREKTAGGACSKRKANRGIRERVGKSEK
jgi:hypothetical protein